MAEQAAAVVKRRRVSTVWIVPTVAMLLGLWLVINAYLGRGPVVEIAFETADGLEEDNTTVRVRDVEVGIVSDIRLNDDLSGVTVVAELVADARRLLREDTQFWVVRPRVSSSGISGLGTIVSGAYIELAPGLGEAAADMTFIGLEQAPLTPAGTPGLRLTLVSETSGSVSVGNPVLYRGYPVGRVENAELDTDTQEVRYLVFIDAPYDALVSANTRFWNASGISAEITTEGVRLDMASLEALIVGGVSFDLPQNAEPGESVATDQVFTLYPTESSIAERPYRYQQSYVVLFDQSVRGLNPGAPVTFRGITVGSVQRIMIGEGPAGALADDGETAIPVLIGIQPARLELRDSPAGMARLRELMGRAIANGLRGSLESGNLLTGSLYVGLDFFESADDQSQAEFEGFPTIPTVSTGLGRLQQQLSSLITKLNDLPLAATLTSAESTLTELGATVAELRALIASDEVQGLTARIDGTLATLNRTLASYSGDSGLPAQLGDTLQELDRTLASVRAAAERLERDPNAMIFPSRNAADPEPRAGAR